ncbi:MAG: farnesyl diphosphate synthase [Oscillospiraceae bacterium]|nr:farnesyl diphosphate synthase [Oscillospiraceae bacterium]
MEARMATYCAAVEEYLGGCFTESVSQKTVLEAMRYSLLAGGKRIRPVLVLEFCRVCGGDWNRAVPFAAALEMIHTYSLIHDDLPCMDNDDYRRGRLTNHKVYGEATAVLAGDGLLTAAFETASRADAAPETAVSVLRVLSACAGAYGMVGGQQLDLEGETRALTDAEIHEVYRLKTGALLSAACRMGVRAAGGSAAQLEAAEVYADGVGLAFQLRDDVLDAVGDSKTLGKQTGMDGKKNTYLKLYGMARCEAMIGAETARAVRALDVFADREFLEQLANQLANRDH